ncbi:unnamed protein product [Camellia sinensis]
MLPAPSLIPSREEAPHPPQTTTITTTTSTPQSPIPSREEAQSRKASRREQMSFKIKGKGVSFIHQGRSDNKRRGDQHPRPNMQRGLPVMSSSSALQSQNQSPPSHVVFQSLIPLELTILGLTYIGKTLSPMETHPANVWAFLFSILIYWLTMGLMIARKFDGETCSQILSYALFISGTFSCAFLFSIFLPNLLGQFGLHAIEIAIGWVRDNFNLQTIANSFGWVQDNLNLQAITNSFDWVRNKFNFARGWVRENFKSQTIANSFGWVQNKFNSARGWVQMMQQQHPSSLPMTSSLGYPGPAYTYQTKSLQAETGLAPCGLWPQGMHLLVKGFEPETWEGANCQTPVVIK